MTDMTNSVVFKISLGGGHPSNPHFGLPIGGTLCPEELYDVHKIFTEEFNFNSCKYFRLVLLILQLNFRVLLGFLGHFPCKNLQLY